MKPIEATTKMTTIPNVVGPSASILTCCSVFRADGMFLPHDVVERLAN